MKQTAGKGAAAQTPQAAAQGGRRRPDTASSSGSESGSDSSYTSSSSGSSYSSDSRYVYSWHIGDSQTWAAIENVRDQCTGAKIILCHMHD